MKHLFIVNPVAGGRDSTAEVTARVAEAFSARPGENYEVYTTSAPMDASRKIEAEAARGGELRVYACGGDGTLNECVCGAVGRGNVAVTHYPCGTGNDFVRCFGDERERFRTLGELLDGEIRTLDAIDCNGRCSVNICSVGIDARIGTDATNYTDFTNDDREFWVAGSPDLYEWDYWSGLSCWACFCGSRRVSQNAAI